MSDAVRLAVIGQNPRTVGRWSRTLEQAAGVGALAVLPLSPADPVPACQASLLVLEQGGDLALFLDSLRRLHIITPPPSVLILADEERRPELQELGERLAGDEVLYLPQNPARILAALGMEASSAPETAASEEATTERRLLSADLTTMALVPETVAREFSALALERGPQGVLFALPDPANLRVLDYLRDLLDLPVQAMEAGADLLRPAIDHLYERLSARLAAENFARETISPSEENAQQLLNLILESATKEKATDIHVEPAEKDLMVRCRTEGRLQTTLSAPMTAHPVLMRRLKALAGIDPSLTRLPLEGHFHHSAPGQEAEFQVSIIPTLLGEKAVLTAAMHIESASSLDALGLAPADLAVLRKFLQVPYGMVLLSGPAGAQQASLQRALMLELASARNSVVSLETASHGHLPGVTQVPLRNGLDLNTAFHALERQDANAVFLEDLPDRDTADLAARFALTGHLVAASVPAPDCASGIGRLLEAGVSPVLAGSAVNVVLAQASLKRICPSCRAPAPPRDEVRRLLHLPASAAGEFFAGTGCAGCNGTGFAGQFQVFELMPVSGAVRRLIFRGAEAGAIRQEAVREGMRTLAASALDRALEGITTLEQVLALLA